MGYGLRLSWPRASDRRRTIVLTRPTLPAQQMLSFDRLYFLNTSTWDIGLHDEVVQTGDYRGQVGSRRLSLRSAHAISKPMSTSWGVLDAGDQTLLSYYEGVLSRIITTVDDDRNGFRHVLIKMALSEKSVSSEAVLQSILAFSAYHLSGSQAGIKHSFAAISALSSSMRVSTDLRDRYYQLAASLVLTTYGVFNTSESKWTMFFCGAKRIARSIFARSQNYHGEPAFLLDWVYGQDALSKFSLLFWPQKDLAQRSCEKDPYLLSKIEDSPHRSLIVGSFGCSIELMSLISELNEMIPTDGSMELVPSHNEPLIELEQRLRSLHQFLAPQGLTSSDPRNESSITDTAEFYRIAALIFLERACRRSPRGAPQVQHLVKVGLGILQRLKVCAVMWPLFVVACEAETDEQRLIVLAAFEASSNFRKAGNILWVQELTAAVWKQDDLFTFARTPKAAEPLLRYGSIISASSQLPNFT